MSGRGYPAFVPVRAIAFPSARWQASKLLPSNRREVNLNKSRERRFSLSRS